MTLENFLVSREPRKNPETALYSVHMVDVHSSGYSYSCVLRTLLFSLRHLKRSVFCYHNFMFIYSVFLNSVKFLLGEFLETPASKSCCSFGRWSISSISSSTGPTDWRIPRCSEVPPGSENHVQF